ncbi:MAG: twin-arginine translocation signal domain-containing protein [Nitrospirota bacterium]
MNRRSFLQKSAIAGLALAAGSVAGTAHAERQPKMRAALKHLQAAEKDLNAATHDKGGHRAEALKHVQMAIDEVKKGVAFDNKR